jgi:DNA-binding GntR family transcriptional regulator
MGSIVLNRTALHEQICNAIRDRILLGDYQPGQRLNIDQLARDMGVSTTPVREALARLVSERLVLFQSNRGYAVTPPPGPQWLGDLFDVRGIMEPYAARVGAPKANAAVLAEMNQLQASIEALDDDLIGRQRFIQFNHRFHNLIIDSAGNRALSEQYKTLSYHTQIALVYRLGFTDIGLVLDEHVHIIEAYRTANGPAAETAMFDHIMQGKARAVAFATGQKWAELMESDLTADA